MLRDKFRVFVSRISPPLDSPTADQGIFGRGTFSSGPMKRTDIYVSSDAFLVKYCLEQATSQRLHFSMFLGGLGKGISTFLPDFFNSVRHFGHLSGYLESVLHSPEQQCLVLTIPRFLEANSKI